jgi:hypothetical protein
MDKFLTYCQAKEKAKYFAKTNGLKIKEEVLIDNRAHRVINRSSLPKEIYNLRKQTREQMVYYLAIKGYSVVLIFNLKETEREHEGDKEITIESKKDKVVYKQLSFDFK